MTEPKHTRGELKVWPTHWAGGNDSAKYDGHNTIWLNEDGSEIARIRTDKGRVTQETYATAARLVQGWNLLNRLEEKRIRLEWLLENLDEVYGQMVEDDCNRLDTRD